MKNARRILSALLVIASLMSLIAMPTLAASTQAFDILSDSNYAKTYTLATSGQTIPYTGPDLKTRGTVTYGKSSSSYIDNKADEIWLLDVGTTNNVLWGKVSYPISGNRRAVAYIPLSALTANNGSHAKSTSTGKFNCAPRKGSANSGSYYVDKGDTVYLVATDGSRYQILYPTSGGKWRLGWCDASDYNRCCAGNNNSGNNNNNQNNDTAGMVDVTAYFAGRTIALVSQENGKYLYTDANTKNAPTKCSTSNDGSWTQYTVSAMTADGWVGLKARANGKYLSARTDITDAPVQARSTKLQAWECFRIYLKGSDFYLKAQANNKWLCVRVDKTNAPLEAYAPQPLSWERFRIGFRDEEYYISATELVTTAVAHGLSPNSNAYKALAGINTKYAPKLSSTDKQGTVVYMFEGVGSDSNASKRMNAMTVVVKNGDIVYLNRNSSTIPDRPFDPSSNQGTPVPTAKSGIHSFTTVNHRDSYAALNVTNVPALRFRSRYDYYDNSSYGINVHRRGSNNIIYSGTPNSAGCLIVGVKGTSASGEYAAFIKALGIVSGSANGSSRYQYQVRGKIVVDRTYAHDYLAAVGYSEDAIRRLG